MKGTVSYYTTDKTVTLWQYLSLHDVSEYSDIDYNKHFTCNVYICSVIYNIIPCINGWKLNLEFKILD